MNACQVCQGTGQVLVQQPNGTPAGHYKCPVCSGRGTTVFMNERISAWFNFWAFWRLLFSAAIIALYIFDQANPALVDDVGRLHDPLLLVWIVLIVGWFLTWLNKKPRDKRPSKHAPGFTTDHEKAALTIFGGVVGGKAAWEAHEQQQKSQK